jgi:tryptophan-rich sensory protein
MSVVADTRNGRSSWLALLGYVAAVTVVAAVGGVAASGSRSTYERLDLPAFAPPGWVFGPGWTVLYPLIALAGWLVWRRAGLDGSMVPHAAQLILNAGWTPLFFAAGWYGVALVEIVVLLATIAITIVAFAKRSRPAALLLVPYAAWVAFATCLNAGVWWLNRQPISRTAGWSAPRPRRGCPPRWPRPPRR